MFSTLKKWFIGRPLKSGAEGEGGLLGKMQALAMLSSDALSSIAYGPEQVILVLMTVSAGAIWWSIPIGIVVLVLLPSRARGLYGDYGELVSQSGVDRWREPLGRLHADSSSICVFRCRCYHVSDSISSSL